MMVSGKRPADEPSGTEGRIDQSATTRHCPPRHGMTARVKGQLASAMATDAVAKIVTTGFVAKLRNKLQMLGTRRRPS